MNGINKDYIVKIWEQFLTDQEIDFRVPQINILFEETESCWQAQIEEVTADVATISINKNFISEINSKEYFDAILYHEFTHIIDSITLLLDKRDSKGKTFLEFPYNEFHSAQIQLLKMMDVFSNNHYISARTKVYMPNGKAYIPVLISKEVDAFEFLCSHPDNFKTADNIIHFLRNIAYNIGYFSIFRLHDIYDRFWLDFNRISFVKNEFEKLMDMLLNTLPSDQLCMDTNKIAIKIIGKILNHYEIERD